jgi:hypothetical protein
MSAELEMTDLEIDKALALAIGWEPEDIFAYCDCLEVSDPVQLEVREFSHKDWATIGPIAERYDCFPFQIRSKADFGKWNVISGENDIMAASPQRAIALAVIGSVK